jgi:hypothetical protein
VLRRDFGAPRIHCPPIHLFPALPAAAGVPGQARRYNVALQALPQPPKAAWVSLDLAADPAHGAGSSSGPSVLLLAASCTHRGPVAAPERTTGAG